MLLTQEREEALKFCLSDIFLFFVTLYFTRKLSYAFGSVMILIFLLGVIHA